MAAFPVATPESCRSAFGRLLPFRFAPLTDALAGSAGFRKRTFVQDRMDPQLSANR